MYADLLLIREPFLSAAAGWQHDFTVVHGQSISIPTVLPHRIGVDAGCCVHGALCTVPIEADGLRFLGVSRNPRQLWQPLLGGQGRWYWDDLAAIA